MTDDANGPLRCRFDVLSQDDGALKLSKSLMGGGTRLGDINPEEEPYKSEFRQNGIWCSIFPTLRATSAFDDVTTVMGMIKRRLAQGQQLAQFVEDGQWR